MAITGILIRVGLWSGRGILQFHKQTTIAAAHIAAVEPFPRAPTGRGAAVSHGLCRKRINRVFRLESAAGLDQNQAARQTEQMTKNGPDHDPKAQRAERLKAALRANLRRRKDPKAGQKEAQTHSSPPGTRVNTDGSDQN